MAALPSGAAEPAGDTGPALPTPTAAGSAQVGPAVPAATIAAKRADLVKQFGELSQQQQRVAAALEQVRGAIAALDQLAPPPTPE